MNVCRICLATNPNLLSIHEKEQGISYYSMIIFVANIKVIKDSYQYICLVCRTKLKDSYNFKLLIEKSVVKLSQYLNIFKFNNINEIKENISIFNRKPKNVDTEYKKFIQNGDCCITFNKTFIKRIKIESVQPEVVDREKCKDSNVHATFHCKKRKNYDENSKVKHEGDKKCNVCIKPVYLKDVRVMKTSITKNVGKKKQIYRNREDICPYCGKRMKIIRKHLLLHTAERKFKCNECMRTFYTKKDLESHIKSHSKERSFKCDNCIAVFQTKALLARHMLIHTNVKDFGCHICSKAFKRKTGLLRHLQIHNILREFKCEICEMSFSTKYGFQHHTRVHTGERPYKCELCSRPYSYKRDFNKHCFKKHGVVIDRRPVRVMNEQVLQQEKALMKNLMLKLHGIPTEIDPQDSFKGPQGAQAFTTALKLLQTRPLQIDVHL